MIILADAVDRTETLRNAFRKSLLFRLRKLRGTLGAQIRGGIFLALSGSDIATLRLCPTHADRLEAFENHMKALIAHELDFLEGTWVELAVTKTWVAARKAVAEELGTDNINAPAPASATERAREELVDLAQSLLEAVTGAAEEAVEKRPMLTPAQAWTMMAAAYDEVVHELVEQVVVNSIMTTDRNAVADSYQASKVANVEPEPGELTP